MGLFHYMKMDEEPILDLDLGIIFTEEEWKAMTPDLGDASLDLDVSLDLDFSIDLEDIDLDLGPIPICD